MSLSGLVRPRDYPPTGPGEGSSGCRLLRWNEDRQNADDLPAFRLLDHHQVDVQAVPRRLDSGLTGAQLRRRIDLGDAAADRDHPKLLLVDVDFPGTPVTLLERLERGVPAP